MYEYRLSRYIYPRRISRVIARGEVAWQSTIGGRAASGGYQELIAASGADTPCLEIPSCSGLSLSTLRCRQLRPSLPEFRGVSGSCSATHSAAHSSGISLLLDDGKRASAAWYPLGSCRTHPITSPSLRACFSRRGNPREIYWGYAQPVKSRHCEPALAGVAIHSYRRQSRLTKA